MKYKALLAALFITLLGIAYARTAKSGVVTGRVVDEAGKPVPNATVVLLGGVSPSSVDLAEHFSTDGEGRFSITTDGAAKGGQYTLYTLAGIPSGAEAPLTPPFPQELKQSDKSFSGQVVTFNKDTIDVGDVPVQVHYEVTSIDLKDSQGNPITVNGKSPDISYRIRNLEGDLLYTGVIPSSTVSKNKSSVQIAIPKGIGSIEIADGGANKKWSSLARNNPNTVSAPIQPNDKESFVQRARKGNARAVEEYLNAGANPNAKDKHGNNALVAAADNVEVTESLLKKGVDVNSTNSEGVTALLVASASGHLDVVKSLLAAGADVNVKAKNGVTPLIAAAGNGHAQVVEALLAAGADVNAKEENGFTALSSAELTSNKGIAEVLRKAGAQE